MSRPFYVFSIKLSIHIFSEESDKAMLTAMGRDVTPDWGTNPSPGAADNAEKAVS